MICQLQKFFTILGAGKKAYCTKTGARKEAYCTKTGGGKGYLWLLLKSKQCTTHALKASKSWVGGEGIQNSLARELGWPNTPFHVKIIDINILKGEKSWQDQLNVSFGFLKKK